MNNCRLGILLTNLGTPAAPTTKEVRRYLKEFLSDPRVISISKWLWLPILHGIILRTRPKIKAADYKKIWTEAGSPLLTISKEQTQKLQLALNEQFKNVVVVLGMRYGSPSINSALNELRTQQIDKLLVLPLYPQYSAATTASTFDAVTKELRSWQSIPEFHFINHYATEDCYINAVVESIEIHWKQEQECNSEKSFLLFSYHGLPQQFIRQGDPYAKQCEATTQLIVKKLSLQENQWTMSYQSRLGAQQWLQPYTDQVLKSLPARGIKNISVICPGFSADCLETLEEISLTNRDLFLKAGGENFSYIPALNASKQHIDCLVRLIKMYR